MKLEPLVAARAKERQREGGKAKVVQNSGQAKTERELAKVAGISHDTMAKGRLVSEMQEAGKLAKQGNRTGSNQHERKPDTPSGFLTIEDIGLTHQQSSRYQREGQLPDAEFAVVFNSTCNSDAAGAKY